MVARKRQADDGNSNRKVVTDREQMATFVPVIWNELGRCVETIIKGASLQNANLIEAGGFKKSSNEWIIRRSAPPTFYVEIIASPYCISIKLEFRHHPCIESDNVLCRNVDFAIDFYGRVVATFEGNVIEVREIARLILEPLITGKEPD